MNTKREQSATSRTTTSTDRVVAAVERLMKAGGAPLAVHLGPEAKRALDTIKATTGAKTYREVVERVLIQELARLSPTKKGHKRSE